MMDSKMKYKADTLTFDHYNETYVCGLAIGEGDAEYLILQRRSIDDEDDWGIHLETNDQILSDYNLIKSCSLSRDKFEIHLNETSNVISIQLLATDEVFENFSNGLKKIFRNTEDLLVTE